MSGTYLSESPTHMEETRRCPGAIVGHGMGGSPRNHPLGGGGEGARGPRPIHDAFVPGSRSCMV